MAYTAITDNYDVPRDDIKVFSEYDAFKDPCRNAKIYKILSHHYDDSEWSVWVDGGIFLPKWKEEEMVRIVKESHKDIGVFIHPTYRNTTWDCIYHEAEVCKELGLDNPDIIDAQIARYRKAGYPEHNGMAACGVIIRHHTEEIKRLNEKWWAEICVGSKRDQISFPFVFRDYYAFDESIYKYKKQGHLRPRG